MLFPCIRVIYIHGTTKNLYYKEKKYTNTIMTKNIHHLLQHQRAEIDRLDSAMIDLLAQRFQVVEQVAHIKHAHNIEAVLPDRIQQVIEGCVQQGEQKNLNADLIRIIWQAIIDTAIAEENKFFNTKN